MTIHALQRRFKDLDTEKIITESITENAEVLGEINLSQLYAGKTREGKDLSPNYLEDPYFDDKGGIAAAMNYSAWKDKITPSPERRQHVPNLIINGFYYSSRHVLVQGSKLVYTADYKEQDIVDKYGDTINGLGGKYKAEFLNDHVGPVVRQKITSATGLKFKR